MTRSRLRNRFLKTRSVENRKLFCKQRNKYVLVLQKSKKHYFENLNENKRFWKTFKLLSILAIASEYKNRENFSFNFENKDDVLTERKMMDFSKAIQEGDILVKIIKANENFFAEAICFYFNKSLDNGKFPNCLKLANITTVFKKDARTSKNNYRPVSIFSVFSKIFEKKNLIIYYLNFNVVLERVMDLNISCY